MSTELDVNMSIHVWDHAILLQLGLCNTVLPQDHLVKKEIELNYTHLP